MRGVVGHILTLLNPDRGSRSHRRILINLPHILWIMIDQNGGKYTRGPNQPRDKKKGNFANGRDFGPGLDSNPRKRPFIPPKVPPKRPFIPPSRGPTSSPANDNYGKAEGFEEGAKQGSPEKDSERPEHTPSSRRAVKSLENIGESRFIEQELWSELTEGNLSESDTAPVEIMIGFDSESNAATLFESMVGEREQEAREDTPKDVATNLTVSDFHEALSSLGVMEQFDEAVSQASLFEDRSLPSEERAQQVKEKVGQMQIPEAQEVLFKDLSSVSLTLPAAEVRAFEVALQNNPDLNSKLGIVSIERVQQYEELNELSAPQVGAPQFWNTGFDGSGIRVAVIDSGLDINHPDFKNPARIIYDDIARSVRNPRHDDSGHGSHVSGTICGDGRGSHGRLKGMASGTTLINIKTLHNKTGNTPTIARAVIRAATFWKADIINMSLGTIRPNTGRDYLSNVVNSIVRNLGVCVVVAAGNSGRSGPRTIGSPGAAEEALTIGAVDVNNKIADFSSRGPVNVSPDPNDSRNFKPDVVAPGVDVASVRANGTSGDSYGRRTKNPLSSSEGPLYTYKSGTSMATPVTAGCCALLLQAYKMNMRVSNDQQWQQVKRSKDRQGKNLSQRIKQVLLDTAQRLPGLDAYSQGKGLIQPFSALQILLQVTAEAGIEPHETAAAPLFEDLVGLLQKLKKDNFANLPYLQRMRLERRRREILHFLMYLANLREKRAFVSQGKVKVVEDSSRELLGRLIARYETLKAKSTT